VDGLIEHSLFSQRIILLGASLRIIFGANPQNGHGFNVFAYNSLKRAALSDWSVVILPSLSFGRGVYLPALN
jgi:hypothetical protein